MTDDSSESKELPANQSSDSHVQSSEPHVVVACPSCKTKFAVESSLIAAYETPKFHCSRCDLVFQLHAAHQHTSPQATPKQGLLEASNSQDRSPRWVLADGEQQLPSNPFSEPRHDASAIKSSDFTLGEVSAQRLSGAPQPFAPLEERAGLSLLGLRPSAGQAISSSVTRRETLNHSRAPLSQQTHPVDQATQNSTTDNNSQEADPFSLFDAPSTPNTRLTQTPITESATVGNVAPPSQPDPLPRQHTTQSPPVTATLAATAPQTSKSESQSDSQVSYSRPARFAQLRNISSRTLSRLSERNQSLVQMSLPIIALLAGCCAISYTSAFAPQTADATFRAVAPSLITGKVSLLPPPQLQVQDVAIEFEKTLSRETLPVVRGVVHNAGDSLVEDVLIEALGFNAQGEVIARAKAPLWSALGREKISDIPLSTVKKYQTSLRAANSSIRSNERVAFTVALLPETTEQERIAYFSARIFSVGRSRR